jgi:hypothetical protein
MTFHIIAMLFGAGIVGGSLAGLVGGASLITFPVLLAIGLPPVMATASNLAAVAPANFIAVLADRSQLPPFNRDFVGLIVASVVGALIGGALLMLTPARTFEVLIPVLLGFATIIFAFTSRLTEWLKRRAQARGEPEPQLAVTSIPMLLPISVYGGYFGSGVGVLLVAVLMLATGGDYRSANIIKNLVTGLNTAVVVVYFALHGAVDWPPTLVMGAGAMLGGLMGGQLARVAPQAVMRVVIVVIGAALTAIYAWRYWF